jgi:tetratricopeptide (TPR) repeat protein
MPAFDSSRDLRPDTRTAWRRLAMVPFAADVDASLTAAVCDIPTDQAAEHLQALTGLALLQPVGEQPGRGHVYRLSETARRQGTIMAEEEPPAAAATAAHRAVDWYALSAGACDRTLTRSHYDGTTDREFVLPDTASAPIPDAQTARGWLEAQRESLHAAVRAGYEAGLDVSTALLVHAMWPYLHLTHDLDLWFDLHEKGCDAAFRSSRHALQRELLNTWGIGLRAAGQFDQALSAFEEVYNGSVAAGHDMLEAQALHELGCTYLASGRFTEAVRHLEQALTLRQRLGYRRGVALTTHVLGEAAHTQERYDQAVEYFQLAHSILREEADPFNLMRSLAWLGYAQTHLGNTADGQAALEQALEYFATGGSPRWHARCAEMLAEVHARQHRTERARTLYRLALKQYGTHRDDKKRVLRALQALG